MTAQGTSQNLWRRLGMCLVLIVAGTAVIAGTPLAIDWLDVAIHAVPATTRALWFLKGFLTAYAALGVAAVLGVLVLTPILIRGRKQRTTRPLVARLLLLSGSVLFSMVLLELSATAWRVWNHSMARLPTHLARPAEPPPRPKRATLPTGLKSGAGEALTILVVGESSARGEPYSPWLSVGQILAWQLEHVFPERTFRVRMWADPGAPLEQQYLKLTKLDERPDILLLFSGHNEFQARFSWSRNVPHYDDRQVSNLQRKLSDRVQGFSPLSRMILNELDRQRVAMAPPVFETRNLIDVPACSPEEYRDILKLFHQRLDEIARFCEGMKTIPIFIIPGSNDAGFEPDRSVLRHDTPPAERKAFAREFFAARKLESQDPQQARERYEGLLRSHPEFAETHFRLGRLCEEAGEWDQARGYYLAARNLDGMPMRCPEDFENAYRSVSQEHPDVILVDTPEVLRAHSEHGILGDEQFHDAQHPTLRSYVALAQEALEQLRDRGAFDWPEQTPAPVIDPRSTAAHFGMDVEKWREVCDHSLYFYRAIAFIRYDARERLRKADAYAQAGEALLQGVPVDQLNVAGLGTSPASWCEAPAPLNWHR